jgi:hypothetical protein
MSGLVSKQESTGEPLGVLLIVDYQIKPEANAAAPDTSTWPLLLKVSPSYAFLT